ncbi:DUF1801 domain-containing protein [Desertibacillus haloalkaliphilus]|uniref:DUF1801 domain-containing protein n=1 Tax=Desertibacillus haloalkaliphilus TaxID=1328930 RepID=UPI001C2552A2|nr:DUF1801 domain-containing protein [Desertibacillus haloalkaliphilus]MBU8906278.1 DUF1801 domain-containing protein [Desertibacillus haloalkaliphilus]
MLEFQKIFDKLKGIIKEYEAFLDVKSDTLDNYYLDSKQMNPRNKKPIFFGAVQIKKNYVSFHLMPIYIFPQLLNDISDSLKKRMQGKSCFNFKEVDDDLFSELKRLTKSGFDKYKQNQLI